MKRQFKARPPRRAFTLIELLAVIAIIAILAAFLFPMIGRAVERGKRTQCLSNMRQWGTALTGYLGDNEGVFPKEGMGGSSVDLTKDDAWFNILAPLIDSPSLRTLCSQFKPPRPGHKNLFMCPSLKMEDVRDADDQPAVPTRPNGDPVFAYGYNLWLDHNDDGDNDNERIGEHNGASAFGERLRVSQLTKPSRTAVFGEVANLGFDNMAGYHLRFRHDGTNTVNIVFADGHASNFGWTNVFVDVSVYSGNNAKKANVGVIWDPEGIPPQSDPRW